MTHIIIGQRRLAIARCYETLYYCEGLNGGRFVPLSQSRAVRYATRAQARTMAVKLASNYNGLTVKVQAISEAL